MLGKLKKILCQLCPTHYLFITTDFKHYLHKFFHFYWNSLIIQGFTDKYTIQICLIRRCMFYTYCLVYVLYICPPWWAVCILCFHDVHLQVCGARMSRCRELRMCGYGCFKRCSFLNELRNAFVRQNSNPALDWLLDAIAKLFISRVYFSCFFF